MDAFVSDAEKRQTISRRLFGTYNNWLALLGDGTKRNGLESLSHDQAGTDKEFQGLREMSSDFAKGLQLLFFNRDSDPDPIAQLSLEYVAF